MYTSGNASPLLEMHLISVICCRPVGWWATGGRLLGCITYSLLTLSFVVTHDSSMLNMSELGYLNSFIIILMLMNICWMVARLAIAFSWYEVMALLLSNPSSFRIIRIVSFERGLRALNPSLLLRCSVVNSIRSAYVGHFPSSANSRIWSTSSRLSAWVKVRCRPFFPGSVPSFSLCILRRTLFRLVPAMLQVRLKLRSG